MSTSNRNSKLLARNRKRSHQPSMRHFQPGLDGWYGKDQSLIDIFNTTVTALKERYGSAWVVRRLESIDDEFVDAINDPATWH